MKSYSRRTLGAYISDVSNMKDKELVELIEMANDVTMRYDKGFESIGILDLNDLIQETNLILFEWLRKD